MSKRVHETGATPETAAPMEQVRELLFGAQLKDMETRFQRREERFSREVADARDAMKKRLDSLEFFMKSETAALLARLKEEKSALETALKDEQRERRDEMEIERRERAEAVKAEGRERVEAIKVEQRERVEALNAEARERAEAFARTAKDIAAMNEATDRRLSRLADSLDGVDRELRDLLLAESTGLAEKIEEKYQEALGVLSKTAAQIRQDMVYRSNLSSMLTEVAVKLSGQWTLELDSGGAGGVEEEATEHDDDRS